MQLEEFARISGECGCNGCGGRDSRADEQHSEPASRPRIIWKRLGDVGVFRARFGKHRRKLCIGKRSEKRDHGSDDEAKPYRISCLAGGSPDDAVDSRAEDEPNAVKREREKSESSFKLGHVRTQRPR